MHSVKEQLLNDFQRDFPLTPAPFDEIAGILNTTLDTVLDTLKILQVNGSVSRVGPVFRPNTIGASTLAAMAVPEQELEEVASAVSSCPQVNHNYEREHHFNLWFVVTAKNTDELNITLTNIQINTGISLLNLPLLAEYHIDLGFRMPRGPKSSEDLVYKKMESKSCATDVFDNATPIYAEELIAEIQAGLPLVAKPYQQIANRIGWDEQAVINSVYDMIKSGVIKRLGVVVRHRELGYHANAMVVWDVAEQDIDKLGKEMGSLAPVTLCYQRPRVLPQWPYNLFSMIHGRDRDSVMKTIEQLVQSLDLAHIPRAVLFSRQCFKQRGARYRATN